MKNKFGFTMVELLVVLVIIGILAAVATPLFFQNIRRARASEAVGTMSLIRQAMRDYNLNRDMYFSIDSGNIQNNPPTSSTDTSGAGLGIDAGVTQYFSNQSYSVIANPDADDADAPFENPGPVDFLIKADGDDSEECNESNSDNCALKENEVEKYKLEMDNSGRIFVCYDCGPDGDENWSLY